EPVPMKFESLPLLRSSPRIPAFEDRRGDPVQQIEDFVQAALGSRLRGNERGATRTETAPDHRKHGRVSLPLAARERAQWINVTPIQSGSTGQAIRRPPLVLPRLFPFA